MKKLMIGLAMFAVVNMAAMPVQAQVQEHKHEQRDLSDKKAPASTKTESMKCCESINKIGEMKAGMAMKSEMTGEMKAKMDSLKEMKEKITEKMGEKGMKMQTKESKVEKIPTSKDAHQH